MKLRFGVVFVLCALMCSAQVVPAGHVISPFSHRKFTNVPLGGDWAVSLGATAGMAAGQFVGVVENGASPDCTNDYLIVPINATPAVGGQANLLLLNNIYRGTSTGLCGTGNPTTKAAYAVGTSAITSSQFTLSSDGTKLMVFEGGKAKVHIITVGTGGTVTSAIAPTDTVIDYTNITNSGCTAGSVHTANQSDVWYDFATDEAYAGDDNGKVYHFSHIFTGTPTMDFCGTLNIGHPLGIAQHWKCNSNDCVYVVGGKNRFFRTQVNSTRTGFTNETSMFLAPSTTFVGINAKWMPLMDNEACCGGGSGTKNIAYIWTSSNAGGTQSSLYQINASATPMSIMAELSLGPVATSQTYQMGWMNTDYFENGNLDPGALGYTCVYPSGASGAPKLASYNFSSTGAINGFLMTGNPNINPSTGTDVGNTCTAIRTDTDSSTSHTLVFVSTGNGTTSNTSQLSRFDDTVALTNTSTPSNTIIGTDGLPGGTSFISTGSWDSTAGPAQTDGIEYGTLARPTNSKCGGTSPNFNFCVVHVQELNLQ